jgi:UDP-N-acetylglucosamine--N-acetylmuramyl-(pentapeptide) pyrophosphoryl-undecaprenol N-acetylglucosamine transferase
MCLEKEKLEESFKDRFVVTKYVDNDEIGFVLNNIDFFLGRAGANTVYEMGILQIPSILIPIPWVTNNEQQKNAEVLKSTGLATIISEAELTPEKLQMTVNLFTRKELDVNLKKIKDIFVLNAQKKIVDNINF